MPGGSINIIKTITGTLSVTITRASAGSLTVYSDAAFTSAVSFPDAITASKRYYLNTDDDYVISVKRNGYEIAAEPDGTQSVRITGGKAYSIEPRVSPDSTLAAGELTASPALTTPAITGPATVTASTGVALKVTNTGSGNSFVVEDSASTDATPFVVDASGNVGIGTASPTVPLHMKSSAQASVSLDTSVTSTAGSEIAFTKARGAIGASTVVASGDQISRLLFNAFDGSAFQSAAAITASVDGTPGAGDMPGRLGLWASADGTATLVERLRVDNAGLITGAGTSLGAWTAYTPTWGASGTAPVLGNGTISGKYCIIGKTCFFYVLLTLGSTSTVGTGGWNFTLPTADAALESQLNITGQAIDVSASQRFPLAHERIDTTRFYVLNVANPMVRVAPTVPFTWTPADADKVVVNGTYQIA